MSEWQNGTRNLRFSSNFELKMTINWQWYTLQRSFLCNFVEKFNSKTLIISLNVILLNIKKYLAKCYPYPLIFWDVWKLFQFDKEFKLKNSMRYEILNMNLLCSIPPPTTSLYSFRPKAVLFWVWIFLSSHFSRFLTIFGQFYHVQSNGENFQVGVFAFLTSDSVSTQSFSLENVSFLPKSGIEFFI